MLERTYIIPLRKEWLKAQRYKRAKKAVKAVKEFLEQHMKSEDVRLLPELNCHIWRHGIKNPPCRVKVTTVKTDEGIVYGQLFGKKIPLPEDKKKETPKKPKETEKKETKKAPEKKEAAEKTEAPVAEKTETPIEKETAEKKETSEAPKKAVKKTVKKAVKKE